MVRSLGIALEPGRKGPIYRQIIEALEQRIRTGVLPSGYRLPPTRALAEELGTHRNTVVRAYDELADAGLLVSTVGRGTFVAERTGPLEVLAPVGDVTIAWGSLLSRAARSEPFRRAARLTRSRNDAIDLQRMQPPPELLPHEQLRKCIDHVLRTRGPRALAYAPREGVPLLREQIVRELQRTGVPATPETVMITTGSQQGLDVIARALIDPGDAFLVDERTYSGAINVLTAAGARLIGVPSDEQGPDMNALRRLSQTGIKGFYLMPNGGNPTGRSISAARRRELVEWSRAAGVPLIEDDYGADMTLTDITPPPSLRALDKNVIYVGTFSKKLIPALRVGFMVVPTALTGHLMPLKHCMDLGTSALLQYALAEFIERGYLKSHLTRVRTVYRERYAAIMGALDAHMPPGVDWLAPDTGVVLWLELPPDVDPETVFHEAQRRGVLITPGSLTAATGQGRRGLRLTFCHEPPDRLIEGVRRLGEAISATLPTSVPIDLV